MGFPETGVIGGVSCQVNAGNQPRYSGTAAGALNQSSPAPQQSFYLILTNPIEKAWLTTIYNNVSGDLMSFLASKGTAYTRT